MQDRERLLLLLCKPLCRTGWAAGSGRVDGGGVPTTSGGGETRAPARPATDPARAACARQLPDRELRRTHMSCRRET